MIHHRGNQQRAKSNKESMSATGNNPLLAHILVVGVISHSHTEAEITSQGFCLAGMSDGRTKLVGPILIENSSIHVTISVRRGRCMLGACRASTLRAPGTSQSWDRSVSWDYRS